MLPNLPIYVSVVFIITTLLSAYLFYQAAKKSILLIISVVWLTALALLSLSGFFIVTSTISPRLLLVVIPPFALMIYTLVSKSTRQYLYSLDPKLLTLIHTLRIPVEVVLFWLFINGLVPQLMTFEGKNFDIISGITAILIFFLGYKTKILNPKVILLWNFICLGLVLFIVINAALSAPSIIQQFAFEDPNIAILYFPFVWLPGYVVPIVIFSHLVVIKQIVYKKSDLVV